MNIKSLLLGSAAALAVVSGAQAADAIVAAEPEPAEYVKVCDAFGSGFFYIPGTENCLKIGGYVRFNVGFNSNDAARKWDATTKADINVTGKSETEFGALTGYIEAVAVNDDGSPANLGLDAAYIQLGGLKAGYFASYFDAGIGENSGWASKSKFNAVSYTYEADGFGVGLGLDETGEAANGVGIEGQISAGAGPFSARIIGVYDTDAENGAAKSIASIEAGPGTLSVAGLWSNGENIYTGKTKWAVGAAYAVKATDQLSIMPEFQVSENLAGEQNWFVGALTSYQIAPGLSGSLDLNYNKDNSISGYFRLQRSF